MNPFDVFCPSLLHDHCRQHHRRMHLFAPNSNIFYAKYSLKTLSAIYCFRVDKVDLCITYVPNMELQDQSNLQEKKAFLTLYYNTNSLMNFLLLTAYVFYLESHKKRQIICMIKILTASSFISFFYITVLHLYSFSLTYKTELNSD